MSSPEDSGRISVSRDALRADLGQLELRLIDRLASRTELEAVRVTVLDHGARLAILEARDLQDDAVKRVGEAQFSRREKALGFLLTVAAITLNVLVATKVVH